jgi:diadenosine tetraphosphate (Ap4A) HIT family hydrolase
MFTLHPRLEADCIALGDFPLSRLLLMNDTRYPWFILVPRHEDIQEIYQLPEEAQQQLQRESSLLGSHLMACFGGDKLNIAALGNLVSQLHIHHIVRYRDDEAWPGPVWGVGLPSRYGQQRLAEVRERIASLHEHGLELG